MVLKKRYKLKILGKIIIILIGLIALYMLISHFKPQIDTKCTKPKEIAIQEEKAVSKAKNDVLEDVQENIEQQEEIREEPQEVYQEPISNTYTTRMTSYYPEEGETTTASGLGINNFGVNDKGWFTYQDKLVVATASNRLGYTEMRTYNLYDEVILTIDGVDYDGIVLDVCGACQRDNRVDLFVSSYVYAKDTNVTVKIR